MSAMFKTDSKYTDSKEPFKIQINNLSLEIKQNLKCNSCSYFNCNHEITRYKNSLDITLTDQDYFFWKADMKQGLFNAELSDIIFEVEDEQIHANKVILSVRSPVFHKMFSNDFKEKKEKVHKVNEFSKESFKEVIRYIYTGEIEDLNSNVYELLHASDFYQISGLKIRCENKLLEMINDSSAHSIFQESHKYNCSDELKKKAFQNIKKIFTHMVYELPDNFTDNPLKVNQLFSAKEKMEAIIKEA